MYKIWEDALYNSTDIYYNSVIITTLSNKMEFSYLFKYKNDLVSYSNV